MLSASGSSRLIMNPVAQVAVPRMRCIFTAFPSQPFGINVVPEGSWRITESDRLVTAIREEKGMCFLVCVPRLENGT